MEKFRKDLLVLLSVLSLFLLILLTVIATKQNNDIEDLQAQIELQQEQLQAQQDYIEEVHSYINDYTYENSGKVFIYIDDDGNHYD